MKSMLHDWPDDEARRFLAQAVTALSPGGTLLIFERAPLDTRSRPVPYSLLLMLLFFRCFRPAELYTRQLEANGLEDIRVQTVELDTTFWLVTARKT